MTIVVLQLLFPIIRQFSSEAHAFLVAAEVRCCAIVMDDDQLVDFLLPLLYCNCCCSHQVEPYFALPWILTWFSHSLHDLDTISRLFDLFLVSHPLLPLYMAAAVMC